VSAPRRSPYAMRLKCRRPHGTIDQIRSCR
jgi:hypothetical protein